MLYSLAFLWHMKLAVYDVAQQGKRCDALKLVLSCMLLSFTLHRLWRCVFVLSLCVDLQEWFSAAHCMCFVLFDVTTKCSNSQAVKEYTATTRALGPYSHTVSLCEDKTLAAQCAAAS